MVRIYEEWESDRGGSGIAGDCDSGCPPVGRSHTATGTDESVFEASGNTRASVTGTSIMKASGDASSADDSSFKGVNSGVRVYGNAEVTLKDCTIESDAENATGVFAYENGVVHIADCTVNVTGGGAGGVQVAGGGTLYGSNLTVTTASKAAIRSDRGGVRWSFFVNGVELTETKWLLLL